jgi:hypothetical protein
LDTATDHGKRYLEAEVMFQRVGRTHIQALMKSPVLTAESRSLGRWIIPPDDPAAVDLVAKALERAHERSPDSTLLGMIQAHPLFADFNAHPVSLTRDDIFSRAASYLAQILMSLHKERLSDGNPLIENSDYSQFKVWETLAASQDRADLLIISHPIASAESEITLPTALRGGINAGMVAASQSPLQGTIVISAFPFFHGAGVLAETRGHPSADPVAIMALYLVHELGHLLRRWGHAWNHPEGCIMRPALSLDYEDWYRKVLGHGPCLLEHPRMKQF